MKVRRELRKDLDMGVHQGKEDPGKIHRSRGIWCSGVSGKEREWGSEGKDGEMRANGCPWDV